LIFSAIYAHAAGATTARAKSHNAAFGLARHFDKAVGKPPNRHLKKIGAVMLFTPVRVT
jgi:hypothetical protein